MIGTGLGLEDNDLQSMAQANTNDTRRLSAVLNKWIQMDGQASPVTWRTIIKVIQGPIVRNNATAKEIFQECKQKNNNSNYIQCIL